MLTESGSAVADGSKVTATGEGTIEFSSGFINVFCNDYWMTWTMHRNISNSIGGTIDNVSFNNKNPSNGETENCASNLNATKMAVPGLTNEGGTQHWCVISNSETGQDKAQVVPHACTGTGGAFTLVFNNTPGGTVCRYTRTTAINMTYETNVTPATLKVEGAPEFIKDEPSGFLCSSTGNITVMSFILETEATGTGLSIS